MKFSRRSFAKTISSSVFAFAAAPMIVPNSVISNNPPSDQVVVAHIGLGWRGFELLRQTFRNPKIRVAALCDLDYGFLTARRKFMDDQHNIDRKWVKGEAWETVPNPQPENAVDCYSDYRYLLERKDIDAMMIAVPDHWHAKTYIDAMDAGFDIYGEKPLTLTIHQGRQVVNKAHATERVFQTGLQQRSNELFRRACEYVRNGRLGKLQKIRIIIRGTEVRNPVPNEIVPPGLDWEQWLGPAEKVPFNPLRCHVFFRYFFDYSGGQITDLGTHHADIAQWALKMDHSGPRFIEGTQTTKPGAFNTFTTFNFKLTYENDVDLIIESGDGFDMIFYGMKGEIFVNRSKIESTPPEILNEPLKESDERVQVSHDHIENFISCIKSREHPIADVEIGHRSSSVCHLANICGFVNRKLEWDPTREQFVNDSEANEHLQRPAREPYGI